MTERWTIVDVDVRSAFGAIVASAPGAIVASASDDVAPAVGDEGDIVVPPDVAIVDIRLWWGPAAIGDFVVRREELPLSERLIWTRFAELVSPLVLARMSPDGRCRPHSDGSPDLSGLWSSSDQGTGGRTDDESLADRLDRLLLADAVLTRPLDVDVVVCTRDRGSDLSATLDAIVAQSLPARSIVVVDNNDRPSAELRRLVEALDNGSFVHEPRPGLSVARNAGIRHATSSIIAFTDDDVVPHPDWLRRVVAPFGDERIAAVTGLVLAADLDSASAVHFQQAGGLGGSMLPLRFDEHFFAASLPYGVPVWRIGSGANMAIRRSWLERHGGFDERLGAGASGCSEDSEIWYRVLAAGEDCVNEPLAIVWHRHRASMSELRRQIHAYQRGHVAALVAQDDRHHHDGNRRRSLRQLPAHYMHTGRWLLMHPRPQSLALYLTEVAGFARGLGFYARRRWRADDAPPRIEP